MDYAEAREAFFQPRAEDAPPVGTSDWQSPARRLRDAIEPVATICFWSEPAYDAYAAHGLDFLEGYVWGRASVLGEPEAPVAAASFAVFEPAMVAALYDAGRAKCRLDEVRTAKETGAVTALRTVLGEPEGLADTVAALRRGAAAADPIGRPMHAGLTALAWPEDTLGQLWHACTVLREHRGDGHLSACVAAGLSGVESNILTELRVGWEPLTYTASRAWSPEAMESATRRLTARVLVDDGRLTDRGRALRDDIERTTDALMGPVMEAIGDGLTEALDRLESWSRAIVRHGWFPPDPYKRASG